jgi:hypothetical protein
MPVPEGRLEDQPKLLHFNWLDRIIELVERGGGFLNLTEEHQRDSNVSRYRASGNGHEWIRTSDLFGVKGKVIETQRLRRTCM